MLTVFVYNSSGCMYNSKYCMYNSSGCMYNSKEVKSMAVMKTCKKCGRNFPLNSKYFNKNDTTKDGYQSYCRACQRKEVMSKELQKRYKEKLKKKGSK